MKRLFTLITFLLITLSVSFMLKDANVVNAASTDTVNIVSNSGATVKYRGSNEPIKKLKNYNYPTQQLRAAWVSNFVGSMPNYTSPSKWKSDFNFVLDRMQSVGLNTIVYHIRSHNNAVYPSKYNPKAKYVSGINFEEFDPLTYMVEETHRRGMEFHAWLNPYRVDDSFLAPGETYPSTNPASNPANLLVSSNGKKILNPGLPEVREFIINTCMEVVENYDVDAIHFDDYFYISGIDDTATRNQYNTNHLSVDDFRREQVNKFIKDLSAQIRAFNKANNKAVQLGIAPTGIYRNGSYASAPTYDSKGNLTVKGSATAGQEHYGGYLYADTLKWINEEWIDYIMPQMYWGIDFNVASFGALTRWWSWAVANKKVNLYCGMGIYMADGNKSGWGKLDNEVRDQLLNMGTHDEIGGMSLYSYNYINSSNSLIKKGMDTLKNDFFNKFVPADVKKSYSDLPSYAPSTVTLSGNNLSWTPVDGARGYMVYEVPKGTTPDKNNIDHVFKYTTTTSITIGNSNKDYYVATVNQANVVSKAKEPQVGVIDGLYVKNLISQLPANITLANEAEVNNIDKLFKGLSSAEQAKVTNIDVLNAAKKKIADLHRVKDESLAFISSIDRHIVSDRKLPAKEGFSWSYVDSSDANIYDINTGKLLKHYLDKKFIELNLTHTLNGLTHSEKVRFNVGLTSEDETPLFYRNDASCMGKDDDGAINPGEGKWIGWSNAVLRFDNKILFIADKNYQAVSNVSEIKEANWTSCASVTKNISNGNLVFNINKVHPAKSSNTDLYFIISNGVITGITSVIDYNEDITLKSGESLVVLRYLDNLNFGSIIYPFENYEGKAISLSDYSNPDSLAAEIVKSINSLPEEVTLDDEQLVMDVYRKYTALPDASKALVTNYSKLERLVNTINQIKKEQADFNDLLAKLNSYYSGIVLTNYPYNSRDKVKQIIDDTLAQLKQATTITELNNIDTASKDKLSSYHTYQEDINLYKSDIISDLEKYVVRSNYSQDGITKINKIISDTTTAINNASTMSEIDTLFAQYKQKIDDVDTLADELNAYKNIYSKKVRDYVVLYAYSDEDQVKLNKLIKDTQDLIGSAKSKEQVNQIYDEFTAKVDTFQTLEEALAIIKKDLRQKINDLEATYDYTLYLENDANRIKKLFEFYLQDVDSIKNGGEAEELYSKLLLELSEYKTIEALYSEAFAEINDTLELYYNEKLDSINTYGDKKALLGATLTSYIESLNLMTKEEIIHNKNTIISDGKTALNNSVVEINNVYTSVNAAIEEISKFDKTEEGTAELIDSYTAKLKQSKSVDEVTTLVNRFKSEYNDLTATGCANCGSTSAAIILSIITVSTCLFLALRKKH